MVFRFEIINLRIFQYLCFVTLHLGYLKLAIYLCKRIFWVFLLQNYKNHIYICLFYRVFARGRALAYAGLCKMMSCRHDKDFNEEYYPHFYRALLKGLSDQDFSITLAIINNSTRLFSQNLPGCNILYRSLIETIRNLLFKH